MLNPITNKNNLKKPAITNVGVLTVFSGPGHTAPYIIRTLAIIQGLYIIAQFAVMSVLFHFFIVINQALHRCIHVKQNADSINLLLAEVDICWICSYI